MSTSTITSINIKSADLKGASAVEFNANTLIQTSPIVLRWAGNSISFTTVSEFHAYVNEVIFPTISVVFNTNGQGIGGSTLPNPYVASSTTMVN